ncbi:hypothetical protein THRCLA_22671 [Thraustotheca clavata]|uniref:DUF1640 domain-containing protein n=1 Tax=Thraustotheca clavata TaxID=74557 RepID=A0A1V9YUT4_9STRA|nr:hypothetical protein THRCLA_22671 [Thraustotheca clavata]
MIVAHRTVRRYAAVTPLFTPKVKKHAEALTSLQEQGYSAPQAQGMIDAMSSAFQESYESQATLMTTKAENNALKSEVSERLFNSTLKFDIAQRSMRELLERDFKTLKQDIHMMEKLDFENVRAEIAEVEKKFLLQRENSDEILHQLNAASQRLEKRILQYAIGFGTTIFIVLGVLGSLVVKS